MNLMILPGSLSKTSQSHVMARKALAHVPDGVSTTLINPKELDLQFCDGRDWDGYNEDVSMLQDAFKEADAYIFAVPVYNWSYSGVFKNMVDLVPPGGMGGSVAGLMAKGGGQKGFLMVQRELRSLLSYFNVQTLPETVFASNSDFDDENTPNEGIEERIRTIVDSTIETAERLDAPTDQGI